MGNNIRKFLNEEKINLNKITIKNNVRIIKIILFIHIIITKYSKNRYNSKCSKCNIK